jgi:hypothetical protein
MVLQEFAGARTLQFTRRLRAVSDELARVGDKWSCAGRDVAALGAWAIRNQGKIESARRRFDETAVSAEPKGT